MGVGCGLWIEDAAKLALNDWTEVAEVMAVGRRLQSLMVLGRKELNRTG